MSGLIALAVYLAAWFAVTGLCSLRCKGLKRILVSPLLVAIKFGARLQPRRKPGAKLVNAVFTAMMAASFALFYVTAGVGVASKIAGAGEGPVFVPLLPGLTVSLDLFLQLLPAVSVAVIVHEVMHAVAARINGVPVKGYGVGVILGLVPIAFVELDDSVLARVRRFERVAVFSAGVAGNLALALAVTLGLALAGGPSLVVVIGVEEGSPAQAAGLQPGSLLVSVNGVDVESVSDVVRALANTTRAELTIISPRGNMETVVLEREPGTRYGIIVAELPSNLVRAFGLQGAITAQTLLTGVYAVNYALALVNAAPLLITDGAKIVAELVGRKVMVAASIATLALLALVSGPISG